MRNIDIDISNMNFEEKQYPTRTKTFETKTEEEKMHPRKKSQKYQGDFEQNTIDQEHALIELYTWLGLETRGKLK